MPRMQSANSDPTVTSSTTPPDVEIAMAIAKAGVQMSGIKDINIHDGRMKRQISRGARRMCLACACASAIIIIISAVGLIQLFSSTTLEPEWVEVRPVTTGSSAGAVDIAVGARAAGFPSMHRVRVDIARCVLQKTSNTSAVGSPAVVDMLALELTAPMLVSSGTDSFTASANLSIEQTAALRATIKQMANHGAGATPQLHCAASGKLTSGAVHLPVGIDFTLVASEGAASPKRDHPHLAPAASPEVNWQLSLESSGAHITARASQPLGSLLDTLRSQLPSAPPLTLNTTGWAAALHEGRVNVTTGPRPLGQWAPVGTVRAHSDMQSDVVGSVALVIPPDLKARACTRSSQPEGPFLSFLSVSLSGVCGRPAAQQRLEP